ncbi:hypothetical protein [Candidatus Reidiella endopervernicosa]|uniref:Uncharacterized protein n=1 Tax=Candidatus Reidiella endopervernicosa TaxID=2738883 RepID=A0A6N0HXA7_9GAMM|nr:hypothetical protein [Candidatus Reidiella endopervernicosa]QKQ26992.1 hypothetical protein HUE57_12425 [Candidatus Reidiella endopervernicosa]
MDERYSQAQNNKLQASIEFQVMLNDIAQRISKATSFFDVMPEIEADMLRILRAERVTIYKRDRNGREICRGVAILRKHVLGIQAQASGKYLTRPFMPTAPRRPAYVA